MATSVKMRDVDKRRLDRLQGALTLRSGRKVSQEELLSWLLNMGERNQEQLYADGPKPMTEKEITAMSRLSVRTGIRTREEEIDAAVAEGSR